MKRKITFAFSFLWVLCAPASAFTLSGFDSPESIVRDPEDGSYYVSNVNGGFAVKDSNGYVSRISRGGNILIQTYLGVSKDEMALNAPKGLAIAGDRLYVTDIDTVKVFDKKTKKPVALVDLSKFKAEFLNDIAVGKDGLVYVSDTVANRIYRIDSAHDFDVSIFKEGRVLGHPNGLIVNPKTKNLMVACWESGNLLEIDRFGNVHVLKRGLSTLDGMDYDENGNLYVSSFERGEIYKIARMGRGELSVAVSGLTTPADISYDRVRRELLIPSMKAGRVSSYPVSGAKDDEAAGSL